MVPAGLDGVRLDRAVALLTDRSRAAVSDLLGSGAVRVDGAVVRRGSRPLRAGQRLGLADDQGIHGLPPTADPAVDFGVVFADEAVVVVEKPAGLVVHPGAGHRDGTLVHGLLARFPDVAELAARPGGDPDRPGIVHRLDRGTSGLLVVARTPEAYESLVGQMARREVRRRYRALVEGEVASPRGVVDAPVGRSERDPTRMAVTRRGRPARTAYEVERRLRDPAATLLLATLETGRTHQVRVHLAAIGHPVVGDDLYGTARSSGPSRGRSRRRGRSGQDAGEPPARPFLHASELAFEHPVTGATMAFTSELPEDFAAELARREGRPRS